jgi:hypothetical protein
MSKKVPMYEVTKPLRSLEKRVSALERRALRASRVRTMIDVAMMILWTMLVYRIGFEMGTLS